MIIAVCDACVLHPAALRNFLMYLAIRGGFAARWTDRIHDEWTRSVMNRFPDMTRERLRRTRDLMNAALRDCLVTGYEPLVPTLLLPDPDDRHVLAAAIVSKAKVILTENVVDFPAVALDRYGIAVKRPGAFVLELLSTDPAVVRDAFVTQRQSLSRPPRTADELLDDLARCGLTATAAALRPFVAEL